MAFPGGYGGPGQGRPRSNTGPRGYFPGEFGPGYGYGGGPRPMYNAPRPTFNGFTAPRAPFQPEGILLWL